MYKSIHTEIDFISTCFWIPNKFSFCLVQKRSSTVGPGWSPWCRSLDESRCSTEPISPHHWITMVSMEYNNALSIRQKSDLHRHTNVTWHHKLCKCLKKMIEWLTGTRSHLSWCSSFLSTHSGRGSRVRPCARPLSVTASLHRCSRCLQMSWPTTRGQADWFRGLPSTETNTYANIHSLTVDFLIRTCSQSQ